MVIKGATEINSITSLIRVGTQATAITANDHNLTVPGALQIRQDNIFNWNMALVSGAIEVEYNGSFTITSAVNRKTFTYEVSGSPSTPATGTPILEISASNNGTSYNGRVGGVTVIDPTTFTYEITGTPPTPAGGTILVETAARVSGALSIQRAIKSYTAKANGKLWAFAVADTDTISRDRSIFSDATSEQHRGNEYRARLLEPFFVYLFIPAKSSLTGLAIQSLAEDLRSVIYRSLLGKVLPTVLSDETWSMITPIGDRYLDVSNDALYIHEFQMERVVDITYNDTVGPDDNVPFLEVDLDFGNDFGTGRFTADIDLDANPL